MAKASKEIARNRPGRKRTSARRREMKVPALPSPLTLTAFDRKVENAMHRVMKSPAGSRKFFTALDAVLDLELKRIKTTIDLDRKIQIGWPPYLYIPSQADYKAHWPHFPPPASNRYALDWTQPGSWATASRGDGSLLASMGSPTVQGAIEGKSEAGLGILFTGKHTLSRVRIEPELFFSGRHEWNVAPPPTVRVTTRVIGSLYVGGFEQNPVTGGFESNAQSPWRRLQLYDESHEGHGASMMQIVPFNVPGKQAAAEVLIQGGRTYLLSVVAQAFLRVETTNSAGQPIKVTSGTFNTWGSVVGTVREIWLSETVLIQ